VQLDHSHTGRRNLLLAGLPARRSVAMFWLITLREEPRLRGIGCLLVSCLNETVALFVELAHAILGDRDRRIDPHRVRTP